MKTFPSKIFIDGGDPEETRQADAMLRAAGYHGLDGQTTNPTLIAKRLVQGAEVGMPLSRAVKVQTATSPSGFFRQGRDGASKRHASPRLMDSLSQKDSPQRLPASAAIAEYRRIVSEMSRIIPHGRISIQVIGDPQTLTVDEMLSQARDRITWIPDAVIKFPVTKTGFKAAEIFCQEGPVNMTLAFSQEQAAAIYAATLRRGISSRGKPFDVFVSPFVGRLDDRGENGMDVVANILEMYREFGDGHVQVLTASVRSVKHILYALWLKSDVITIPFNVFKEWAGQNFTLPPKDFIYDAPGLADIPYRELTLDKEWMEYDLSHDLTDIGLTRFWDDWKAIVE